LPAVACQVTDRLSVGATAGVGVSRATLHGPYYLQTEPLTGIPAVVDVKSTGATFVWSIGAQYQWSERTRFGLVYQSESRCTLEGNAAVITLAPVVLQSEFDAELDLTWPRSLGLGMTHDLNARNRFSMDLIWINWESAFDSLGMRLSNPSNPVVPGLLGPSLSDQFPLEWNDSLSVRLGYEFLPTDWSIIRAGYVYNINQVPDRTLTPFIPATLEHAFSLGWGCSRGSCGFDIAYQYSFGPRREVDTSDLVGGDFNSSQINAQAHWISLGLTWQY
jgi:long-chain fatty acid transport protein